MSPGVARPCPAAPPIETANVRFLRVFSFYGYGQGNNLRPLGWQRRLTDPSQARKLQPLYFLGAAQVAKTEQKAVTEIELAPPHGCCHARRKELKNDRLEIHKRRI